MVKGVAIVTISDSCFKDNSMDSSGNFLLQFAKKKFPEANIHTVIIPDEKEIIERELKYFCASNIDLILTTGGTGLSSRDVTPEATKAVIQKEVPAISVALTLESLKKTPMAMLSRAVAGVRDRTLIINFPGSLKAVTECIEVVKPVLSHAISLLKEEHSEVKSVHESMYAIHVNLQRQVHSAAQEHALPPQAIANPVPDHICPHKQMNSSVDVSAVALRPRESPYPMIEMSDAFKIVDAVMEQWITSMETITIEEGLGRIVDQPLYAKEPMPPFPASVKDGYACLSSDGVGVRKVRSAVTAGDQPQAALLPGECARINTGAALPPGADCVVQVEDTKLVSATPDNKTELEVEILVAPQPQQDVRPVGFDIPLGSALVEKGDLLDAAQIGLLAGAGFQHVTVRVNPKVGLLSTGNELQDPSEEILRPAHIRDSNRTLLKMLLKEHGYDSIDCGLARDDPATLMTAIASALRRTDILVCTGGVSMGEKDLLKPVLINDFGATIHFGRVRMKPGKPTTFATCEFEGKTKYIFALPGNPVSAYVCCLLFVVRALRKCTRGVGEFVRMCVRLARGCQLDARPEYARAALRCAGGDVPAAMPLGNQITALLAPMSTYTQMLMKEGIRNSYNLSSLSWMWTGAAYYNNNRIHKLIRLLGLAKWRNSYGLSEIGSACTHRLSNTLSYEDKDSSKPVEHKNVLKEIVKWNTGQEISRLDIACSGRPPPGVIIKIVDPKDGTTLGPNQLGEICIKTRGLMKEMYKVNPPAPSTELDTTRNRRDVNKVWVDARGVNVTKDAISLIRTCSSRLLSACGATVLLELPAASAAQRHLAAGTSVFALVTGRIDFARFS